MTVGERIKEVCTNSNMRQVDLALKIGVSKQTLYKYENNIINNIPPDKIEAIANVFKLSPAYFMGWENNMVNIQFGESKMDKEQALHLMWKIRENIPDGNEYLQYRDAIMEGIKVLEKDIPRKVEIKAWSPARCPTCGQELSEDEGDGYYRHPTFLERCTNVECGQRLEW